LESQNSEWKEAWRDEYLKTICAFANANGGVLEIGRDDNGVVVGLDNVNVKRLLEDLPNKIRSATGVVADIDLLRTNDKQYIAISVKPYIFPISCHGKYYYRSGSTTQELSGSSLDEFLLRKQGKTWDGVPVPYVKFDDFESDAFKFFRRRAIGSARLTTEDLDISDEILLDNLMLMDGSYLKRAAILLFHQNPERWIPGAYVKIGYFENAADLLHQDEIHGSLISMADKVVDLVYLKYFKGIISYRGIQRIETYPVPQQAFREAVLNAVVHRDYSTGNPIHIHIYPDKVLIYNDGRLPDTWTEADLFLQHTSKPHNPLIAGVFFRSGQIEAWGRGIEKMSTACMEWGKPVPYYRIRSNEVMIGFNTEPEFGDEFGDKFGENHTQEKIVNIMRSKPTVSARTIGEEIGITTRGVEKSIRALKKAGVIERVGTSKGGRWVINET